jgi:hypothetical protein
VIKVLSCQFLTPERKIQLAVSPAAIALAVPPFYERVSHCPDVDFLAPGAGRVRRRPGKPPLLMTWCCFTHAPVPRDREAAVVSAKTFETLEH